MGVGGFFTWITRRYPYILSLVKEERPKTDSVTLKEIPVDFTKKNPNGIEIDNLYLDMNGIIHPCCHPEGEEEPNSEDEMIEKIFKYMDRIISAVRPRKLIYIAIDGVAPRAKMNQQRSRRFKSARDRLLDEGIEKKQVKEYAKRGLLAPSAFREIESKWDSNVITPGTVFMDKVSKGLNEYIHNRVNSNPGWKKVNVIFSDANCPGEGEHKIVEYIRTQRLQPNYNPQIRHCIHGLDADLIMLGLATHEPRFVILREQIFRRGKQFDEVKKQRGMSIYDYKPFNFFHLNILREYLSDEFKFPNLPFPYNFERIIDDFIFLCFFVGNDFLPHLPSMNIREGALELIIDIYKKLLPTLGGYITDCGEIDMPKAQKLLQSIGEKEDGIFKKRLQEEQRKVEHRERNAERIAQIKQVKERHKREDKVKILNRADLRKLGTESEEEVNLKKRKRIEDMRNSKKRKVDEETLVSAVEGKPFQLSDDPFSTPVFTASEQTDLASKIGISDDLNPDPFGLDIIPEEIQMVSEHETELNRINGTSGSQPIDSIPDTKPAKKQEASEAEEIQEAETEIDNLLATPPDDHLETPPPERELRELTELEKQIFQKSLNDRKRNRQQVRSCDHPDLVLFGLEGWKERYFDSKLSIKYDPDLSCPELRKMLHSYLEGLSWVMKYYYQGCASWSWYYPYHYAPFASELGRLKDVNIKFDKGEPFKPFSQLMSVFPQASMHALPKPFRELIETDELKEFYPTEFKIDLDGAKFEWMGVVLLPFIDEKKLLQAIKTKEPLLTEDEKRRNSLNNSCLYIHRTHPDATNIEKEIIDKQAPSFTLKKETVKGTIKLSKNFKQLFMPLERPPAWKDIFHNIRQNQVICLEYILPPDGKHTCKLMPNVKLPRPVLPALRQIRRGDHNIYSIQQVLSGELKVPTHRPVAYSHQYAHHQQSYHSFNNQQSYSQQRHLGYNFQQQYAPNQRNYPPPNQRNYPPPNQSNYPPPNQYRSAPPNPYNPYAPQSFQYPQQPYQAYPPNQGYPNQPNQGYPNQQQARSKPTFEQFKAQLQGRYGQLFAQNPQAAERMAQQQYRQKYG